MRKVLVFALLVSPAAFADRINVVVMLRVSDGGQARAALLQPAMIAAAQDAALQRLTGAEFALTARWRNIAGFAGEIDSAAISRLRSDPLVERVDPDSPGSGALAESVPLIGGDRVHLLGYTGRGVTVAILDSGVDESHPDLSDRIADEACFCRNANGTGCCPNGQSTQTGAGAATDDHGHGSNVAGIVGSRGLVAPAGVAPGATLVAVKVLDRNNIFASSSQVISGLDWLIDHHPEVRVVNMSLATNALYPAACDATASFTAAFASAINTLKSRGVITFACSGNDGSSTMTPAPACIDSSVSVGAVYDSNVGPFSGLGCSEATTAADQITCFSNSNATLDLLAPGAVITSDYLRGGRSNFWGTSQASPHAAATAAVLLQIDPNLTPDDIERLLKRTGRLITDPRNGVTAPRIDLLAAAQAILPQPASGPRRRVVRH